MLVRSRSFSGLPCPLSGIFRPNSANLAGCRSNLGRPISSDWGRRRPNSARDRPNSAELSQLRPTLARHRRTLPGNNRSWPGLAGTRPKLPRDPPKLHFWIDQSRPKFDHRCATGGVRNDMVLDRRLSRVVCARTCVLGLHVVSCSASGGLLKAEYGREDQVIRQLRKSCSPHIPESYPR